MDSPNWLRFVVIFVLSIPIVATFLCVASFGCKQIRSVRRQTISLFSAVWMCMICCSIPGLCPMINVLFWRGSVCGHTHTARYNRNIVAALFCCWKNVLCWIELNYRRFIGTSSMITFLKDLRPIPRKCGTHTHTFRFVMNCILTGWTSARTRTHTWFRIRAKHCVAQTLKSACNKKHRILWLSIGYCCCCSPTLIEIHIQTHTSYLLISH